MTNRERAMNILHYKDADRLPAVHFGYWGELLVEWAEQGEIPKELAHGNWDGNEKDKILDELCAKHYKKRNDLCREYGIDIISLDCDGVTENCSPHGLKTAFTQCSPLKAEYGVTSLSLQERNTARECAVLAKNISMFRFLLTESDK